MKCSHTREQEQEECGHELKAWEGYGEKDFDPMNPKGVCCLLCGKDLS